MSHEQQTISPRVQAQSSGAGPSARCHLHPGCTRVGDWGQPAEPVVVTAALWHFQLRSSASHDPNHLYLLGGITPLHKSGCSRTTLFNECLLHLLLDNSRSQWVTMVKETDVESAVDTMRAVLRVQHYSHRTEEAYIGWVWRFFAPALRYESESSRQPPRHRMAQRHHANHLGLCGYITSNGF